MPNPSYTRVAIALHWLMAVVILCNISLGVYMHELELSPTKLALYSYHKWTGVTLFLLVILRLIWRATHPAPGLPPHMPAWQRRVAALTHHLLYLLMLAIPLSGWLMSSAKGFQTVYFGVLPIPDLLAKDKALGATLNEVHELLNWCLILLVSVHVAAALKHHYRDRDDILHRMLPLVKPRA